MENSSSLPLLVSPRAPAAAGVSPTASNSKEIVSLPAIDKLSVNPAASTSILQATSEVTVDNHGDPQDGLAGLMRFIRFDHFKQLTEFPRYPQCKEICTDLEQIDRQNSLIIFVSHMWLAGWHGATDWRGKPHPDNQENDKFRLCIEGVAKLFKNLAPSMKECYVWLDFGCIDQDSHACAELRVLDKIVGYCDVILTPIVDGKIPKLMVVINNSKASPNASPKARSPQRTAEELLMSSNIQNENGAPMNGWRSYLSRAWCRMEMFLASQVPLAEAASQTLVLDENQNAVANQRRLKVSKHLGVAMLAGRRPHFYYSTREYIGHKDPIVLAPLLNSYLDEFTPAKGELTQEKDRSSVIAFMDQVTPKYQKATVANYVGGKDLTTGKREGKGREVFANGDVFDGLYVNDKHTTGVMTYCTFNVYTGGFNESGERHGLGKMEYFFGNTCYGLYEHNVLKFGIMDYVGGTYYVGEFVSGLRHGLGMYASLGYVRTNYEELINNPIGVWREDSFVSSKKVEDGDDDDVYFKTMISTLAQRLENRPENDVLRQTWHARDVLQDYTESKMRHKTEAIDTLSEWLIDLNEDFTAIANDAATLFYAANILTVESLLKSIVTNPTFLHDIGITTYCSFTIDLLDKCKREYIFHWMEKNKIELGYNEYLKDEYFAAFNSEGISTAEQLVEMDLPENVEKRANFLAKVKGSVKD